MSVKTDRGRIRSLSRRGSEPGKARAAEASTGRQPEPRVCERCGAVFARRVWRRGERVSHAMLGRATWQVCPACRQVEAETGFGRIVIEGIAGTAKSRGLGARIRNVAAQAAESQPERRIVAVSHRDGALEVLTSSQKLAHRIVHELRKAFGGRASYQWSDDGTLFARLRMDAPRHAGR